MSEEAIEAMNKLANAIEGFTSEIKKQNPNRMLTAKEVAEETRHKYKNSIQNV